MFRPFPVFLAPAASPPEAPTPAPPPSGAERAADAVGAAADAATDAGVPGAAEVGDAARDVAAGAQRRAADAAEQAAEQAADTEAELADAADAAVGEGQEKAASLMNDVQDISFLQIGLVIAGAWLAYYLIRRALPYLAERGPSQFRLFLLGTVPVARLALLTLAVVWIVPLVFNVNLQNFLVIAGAASVAIGFAFKDYVSSLIAGVVAVFERPYRPGDYIKIGEDAGEVVSVGLRTVNLRTPADDVIAVPHGKIWDNNVTNSNDGARTLLCTADFYVAPDHDAAAVRAALTDVGLTSAFLGYDDPVAVQLSESPWGTHYKLKAYPFDMRDQFAFVSDLTVRGKRAVREAGGREVAAPAPGPAAD